jgi:uncharacterized protein (TIGR03083 family)
MAASREDPELGRRYRETRLRLSDLVGSLDDTALHTAVPACPGWSVRDVLSHLFGIVEDGIAGKIRDFPPSDEQTAGQVARYRELTVPEILERWQRMVAPFEDAIDRNRSWPALVDVTSHEQDIRGALGLVGARDTDTVRLLSTLLLGGLRPPIPLRIAVEDAEFTVGPESSDGPVLHLSTTRFEALRWRMGRRSRAQLAALEWTGDPGPVLDQLAVFGPSPVDITE